MKKVVVFLAVSVISVMSVYGVDKRLAFLGVGVRDSHSDMYYADMEPAFDPDINTYDVYLYGDVESDVYIDAVLMDISHCSVSGLGYYTMNMFETNTVMLTVSNWDDMDVVRNVYRLRIIYMNGDVTLENIKLNGLLPSTIENDVYSWDFPQNVSSVSLTADRVHQGQTVTGLQTYEIKNGDNIFYIDVTSHDGKNHKTYVIRAHQASSTPFAKNISLSFPEGFSFSGSKPQINFDRQVFQYSFTVDQRNECPMTISVVPEDSFALFTCSNEYVRNGAVYSMPVAFSTADRMNMTFSFRITSEDGSGYRDYKIDVLRGELLNGESRLKLLRASGVVFTPSFSPDTYSYRGEVDPNLRKVTLETAAASFSKLWSDIPLSDIYIDDDSEVNIRIVCDSENGTSSSTYSIALHRGHLETPPVMTDPSISDILVEGKSTGFTPSRTDYRETVGYAVSDARITVLMKEKNASFRVVKPSYLSIGDNYITVTGIAPDGVTRSNEYSILVRRLSNNCYLTSLSVNIPEGDGNLTFRPNFSPMVTQYRCTLPWYVEEFTVSSTCDAPAWVFPASTIKFPLYLDNMEISEVCTAEDPLYSRDYNIHVLREQSMQYPSGNGLDMRAPATGIYICPHGIYIDSPFAETVRFYTVDGKLAGSVDKTPGRVLFTDISVKGTLIARGDSGWSEKIIFNNK